MAPGGKGGRKPESEKGKGKATEQAGSSRTSKKQLPAGQENQGGQVENITERDIEALEQFLVATTCSDETMANKLDLRKYFVIIALAILTSSHTLLMTWSKSAGKYEHSVKTSNFLVEALKCALPLVALFKIWRSDGITQDNKLTERQWVTFIMLFIGYTGAQVDTLSDRPIPLQGCVMTIVVAHLSGFIGVYTEIILKKRPSTNINVQTFWLSIFGLIFNLVAIFDKDFDDVILKGFFHGSSFITVCMILNHALIGIVILMVLKYADNIVKVYSTCVGMIIAAMVSKFLFGLSLGLYFLVCFPLVFMSVPIYIAGEWECCNRPL